LKARFEATLMTLPEPAAESVTVDRCDHGYAQRLQRAEDPLSPLEQGTPVDRIQPGEIVQVGTRRESSIANARNRQPGKPSQSLPIEGYSPWWCTSTTIVLR
jgi:hypothetical protein